MLGFLYLCFFLSGGVWIAQCLLPRLRVPVRFYIGLSAGVFSMMWLPALWACALRYTPEAHGAAICTMLVLSGAAWFFRDRREAAAFGDEDRETLRLLLVTVVPLTLISVFLQYTHCIRLEADGSLHVGQSTYGDLSLHLAIASGAVEAKFPLQNTLMSGAIMAYPYLGDTFATSLCLMGFSLSSAMCVTGSLMMALVYIGYALLAKSLCKRNRAACLAVFLLFQNGGLGFLYNLDATTSGYTSVRWTDHLLEVLTGYYQTPTNQPDPHNLRWVNIICDMLLPQRGILTGWTLLLPCLNLLLPEFAEKRRPDVRALVLAGLLAGGMPLCHTHSYLALVLLSAGMCVYTVIASEKGKRFETFRPWLLYGSIAALLSLPQLIGFTFVQASGSDHFLSFWFGWANNRGRRGLMDGYFWFYLKNIGIPYILILLPLLQRKPKGELPSSAPDRIYQYRSIACGAFLIYLTAELVKFQPNEYDNNKLLYVWFMLCLPMAADYALSIWSRLKGLPGRRVLAGLFIFTCFASSTLTLARECISDYVAYEPYDVAIAEQIEECTDRESVFLCGDQHLNPVSSLAGRTIVCSSSVYLYFHGFDTTERQADIARFYHDPEQNLDVLSKYGVEYIYVSAYERASSYYNLNEEALVRLFPLVCETQDHSRRVFKVPEKFRRKES